MKKNNSIKTVVAIGIGAALFFVLGRFVAIPSPVPNTNISLQYAVLALLAAMYGPVAGGLIGFIGHTLVDLSWGGIPWWSWVITSAFVGVVVGAFARKLNVQEGDFGKAKAAVFAAYEHQGPVYMRFGRLAVPVINDNPDYKFEIGKGIVLREGKDVTIVATGLEVSESLAAAEKLAADGIDAKVINIHTIKPLDEELIVAAAKETGKVVTVEEHSVIGGLGSAVCDTLSEKLPTPVLKIGVMDTFGESGPAVELIKKYGLDADSIYEKVKAFVK